MLQKHNFSKTGEVFIYIYVYEHIHLSISYLFGDITNNMIFQQKKISKFITT